MAEVTTVNIAPASFAQEPFIHEPQRPADQASNRPIEDSSASSGDRADDEIQARQADRRADREARDEREEKRRQNSENSVDIRA
ncbi:MAG: hypothetical protein QF797_17680 [Alphaproteobacteria bacterium]|jgi:hypothetical protein|nr:hypothetical protein [Alphaproteobacteria bacterium]MDP6620937.1 hypothetical protein [Alphaproteobacteria bacterium]|tara:strand:- start:330 stop:581 length:252 start_codon:yes stop_codon:yes gene_type:complete